MILPLMGTECGPGREIWVNRNLGAIKTKWWITGKEKSNNRGLWHEEVQFAEGSQRTDMGVGLLPERENLASLPAHSKSIPSHRTERQSTTFAISELPRQSVVSPLIELVHPGLEEPRSRRQLNLTVRGTMAYGCTGSRAWNYDYAARGSPHSLASVPRHLNQRKPKYSVRPGAEQSNKTIKEIALQVRGWDGLDQEFRLQLLQERKPTCPAGAGGRVAKVIRCGKIPLSNAGHHSGRNGRVE